MTAAGVPETIAKMLDRATNGPRRFGPRVVEIRNVLSCITRSAAYAACVMDWIGSRGPYDLGVLFGTGDEARYPRFRDFGYGIRDGSLGNIFTAVIRTVREEIAAAISERGGVLTNELIHGIYEEISAIGDAVLPFARTITCVAIAARFDVVPAAVWMCRDLAIDAGHDGWIELVNELFAQTELTTGDNAEDAK